MNSRKVTGLRLRQQLILTSMVPLVLMSIAATVLSTYVLLEASLPILLQQNTSRAQAIAADAATNLNLYMHLLDTTGIALARYSGDPEQQQQTLQDFSPYLVRFNSVILLDNSGNVIASAPDPEKQIGQNYASTDYFQVANSRRLDVFSSVVHLQSGDKDAIIIAVPVLHNGDSDGVLLGIFLLKSHDWAKDLGPQYLQNGMRIILVDVSGNIINSTDLAHVAGNITGDPALWHMVAEREPSSILSGPSLSTSTVVASFAPLPGMYWGLIVEEPFKAISALLSSYQWRLFTPLLVGIILLLVLLLISVNRISKPVLALEKEAIHVSVGDPFGPLKVEGPVELQTLTNNFNQLVNRLEQQQATLRQYANMVVQSQEKERKRVAREMHDDIVQALVGLDQRIQLSRNVFESDPTLAKSRLDDAQHLAKTVMEDVRRISNDLRPIILEDLGLPVAIQSLVDELASDLLTASVRYETLGEEIRLDPEVELTVFRVTQEALTNIRKHAPESTQIEVKLSFEAMGVVVSIRDNGCGLENTEARMLVEQGHLGIAGMQERAILFGGSVEISSSQEVGTVVILHLPYGRDAAQETRSHTEKGVISEKTGVSQK